MVSSVIPGHTPLSWHENGAGARRAGEWAAGQAREGGRDLTLVYPLQSTESILPAEGEAGEAETPRKGMQQEVGGLTQGPGRSHPRPVCGAYRQVKIKAPCQKTTDNFKRVTAECCTSCGPCDSGRCVTALATHA